MEIKRDIKYIGVNDEDLDLFESQYVIKNGVSYNSYLIMDEKVVLMDTVDKRKTNEWLEKLDKELNNKNIDYLVVSHLEPDHSSNIKLIAEKYPNMKIIGTKKMFDMLPQFFDIDLVGRMITVGEGDTISIGKHKLQFFMAPMVHWPEVMVTYDITDKILFSADAFGKFGAIGIKEEWEDEARRYYINIVGRYGGQVQQLLKKASTIDIQTICPLHGPILTENLGYYIDLYDKWSKYVPEKQGVLIAYNSIYGNTRKAVQYLYEQLQDGGIKEIVLTDLARCDISKAVSDAFCYSTLVVACPTHDSGLFPYMDQFLRKLEHKNYQNREVGIIENGSWAPMAGKCMKTILQEMKNITFYEPVVTIKSAMKEENKEQINELAKKIIENVK